MHITVENPEPAIMAEFAHVEDPAMRAFLALDASESLDTCGEIVERCQSAFWADEKDELIDGKTITARREALDEMRRALGDCNSLEFRNAVRDFWKV